MATKLFNEVFEWAEEVGISRWVRFKWRKRPMVKN
ncbi:hypothetical protein [Neobacillus rhizophilus]|nr:MULTISPECIES: hypothetical protein [Neobacillus]